MKKYTYLITFLALTAAIGVVIYGTFFLYGKVKTSLDSQERLALEQQVEKEQLQNLPVLAQTYQKIINNESYFSFLYSEDRVVEIIKDIERIAKEQGVALTITQREVIKKKVTEKKEEDEDEDEEDKKPKELIDSLPYEKNIQLDLKAEGEYIAIRNFLHKLETAPYALDVLRFTAALAPKDEDDQRSNSTPVINDSPFLLQGEVVTNVESQGPAPSEKIVANIEMALYLQ